MPRKKKTVDEIVMDPKKEDSPTVEEQIEKIDAERKEKDKKKKNKNLVTNSIIAYTLCVEIEFLTESYGTSPMDPDLWGRNAANRIGENSNLTFEEKVNNVNEELEFFEMENPIALEKGLTGFPKTRVMYDNNTFRFRALKPEAKVPTKLESKIIFNWPFCWNYQWKGFTKESLKIFKSITSNPDYYEDSEYIYRIITKPFDVKKDFGDILKQYKKQTDFSINIGPRMLPIEVPEYYYDADGITKHKTIDDEGRLPIVQRPIRISDNNGERVAISTSEMIPAGSKIKLEFRLNRADFVPLIIACLELGLIHGFSGRRNDGFGLFKHRIYWNGWDKEPGPWNHEESEEDIFVD